MKIRSGHVPEEVIYVLAQPRTITIEWDDVTRDDGESAPTEEVIPVYVSDAINEKTLATGRAWATGHYRHGMPTPPPPKEVQRKNEPFTGVRIMGLDVRMNGGRAWKCVSEEGYYFDLREDNLLDLMRTVGVSPGGILNGEYMWARIGTEMKLIRVGSEIHFAAIGAGDRRKMPAIHKKNLKPWHLYQQKNGEVKLFVGKVRGWRPEKFNAYDRLADEERYCSWLRAQTDPYAQRSYLSKHRTMDRPPAPARLDIAYAAYHDDLWVNITKWAEGKPLDAQVKNLQKSIEENLAKRQLWDLAFSKDIKVVSELGEFRFPELFSLVRKAAMDSYLYERKVQAERPHQESDFLTQERTRLRSVAGYLQYGTIYDENSTADDSHDTWATWMLSMEPK